MDSIKGALKSKTVWFNLITGALEVANLFAVMLPPGTITAINVVGNVLLRFVTTEPLEAKVK
jgi:hypothetical protein